MRTGRLAASQPARDRRARIAVAALFLTNGALFANLLPRYPEIKTDLGLSNAAYGAAVAAFSVGALVTGPLAASLIRRFHSARVAVWGSVGIAVFVWFAGVAPSPLTFAGALFVAGGADAVTDVAQNAHGLRVQRRYGRSIINSFMRCGRRVPSSAGRWVRVRSRCTSHAALTWQCRRWFSLRCV
jgi:MFS family permease